MSSVVKRRPCFPVFIYSGLLNALIVVVGLNLTFAGSFESEGWLAVCAIPLSWFARFATVRLISFHCSLVGGEIEGGCPPLEKSYCCSRASPHFLKSVLIFFHCSEVSSAAG